MNTTEATEFPAHTRAKNKASDCLSLGLGKIKSLVVVLEYCIEKAADPDNGGDGPNAEHLTEVTAMIYDLAEECRMAHRAIVL